MRRRWVWPVVVAALLSSACGRFEPGAATVRGDPIDPEILTDALAVYVASERFEADAQGPQGAGAAKRAFQQEILSVLIRRRVLRPLAVDMEIRIGDAELEDFIAENYGGEEAFAEGASEGGFDPGFLRELIRDELLAQKMVDQVTEGIQAGVENARAFYDENPEDFEENHLQEIRVSRNEQAIRIINQLRAADEDDVAELFGRLASRFSEDPNAAQGGDLGFVRTSQLPDDRRQIVQDLRPGEFSEPFRLASGLHIVRLVERRTIPFEQARVEIRTQLTQQLKERAFRAWATTAYRDAEVDVYSRFGEFDIDTFSVVDAAPGTVPGTGSPSPTPTDNAGVVPPG